MWLRLQLYDFELVFRPSGEMIMADTLSRAFPPPGAGEGTAFPEEVATLSTVDEDQMAELKMVASANTIAAIDAAAQDDGVCGADRPGTPRLARDSCRSRDMFTTVSHVRRRTQRELRTRVQRPPFGRPTAGPSRHPGETSRCAHRR